MSVEPDREGSKGLDIESSIVGGIEALREILQEDFLAIGDRYGLDQLVAIESDDPGAVWTSLTDEERQLAVATVERVLGTELRSPRKERLIRTYEEKGVPGEVSEAGAQVDVFGTDDPNLEVHVMHYRNQELGVRYDLVRSS